MKKSLFILAPIAAVLLAGMGTAQAASNAQITITANVTQATCDVSLSTANLDLGNYSVAQFTQVATPVTGSTKTFTVGLSNCEAPSTQGDIAGLVISGQTLAGNTNIFNSTGTNTGIMLSQVTAPTTYLSAGDTLDVATASATPAVGDFNGKTLSLQAAVASASTDAD